MSNYRRLISYVYTYEGNVKGKNVGFVKLEARNSQCKISVNVKKVFTGSSDMGVYLLSAGKEVFLGNIFIRGGAGEFRAILSAENIAGSGCSIDECYGLAVHESDSQWLCYKTIWEDAVTHAAEVELAELTSEKYPQEQTEPEAPRVDEELEKEEAAEDVTENAIEDVTENAIENVTENIAENAAESVMENNAAAAVAIEAENALETPAQEEPEAPEAVRTRVFIYRSGKIGQAEPQPEPIMPPEPAQTDPVIHQEERYQPLAGHPEDLTRFDMEEQAEEDIRGNIWELFQKNYPKIQAFDCEHGGEILAIKPQDLGLLPREIWVYGNNSFLLHAYYNYRYLILARLENPKGQPRFLLGVPGHYYNNEKYMASMFGFPHFVLSKKQQSEGGRFGYWYTDVRLNA